MDTFLATHWNQLQTTLWFYSRSRVLVRLAADGRPRPDDLDERDDSPGFHDDPDLIAEVVMPGGRIRKRCRFRCSSHCSFEEAEEWVLDALRRGRLRASGRKNGEGSRERIPQHEWPGLRFYWGRPLPEMSCYLPPAVSRSRRYVGPWNHQSQVHVPYWTDLLFEREEVLALRPDPIRGLLRTTTEPVTLAQAVALLARERPASKEVWTRLRRRHRGRFPATIREHIEDAGKELTGMLQKGEIIAKGRFCDRDEGTEAKGKQRIDDGFLDESLWVDPCADGIWTEPDLRDGRFNPTDRGYRDVSMKRAQFETEGGKGELPVPREEVTAASLVTVDDYRPAERQIGQSERIKRKGGRPAPWVHHLEKYLRLRVKRGDDILSMSLADVRADFKRHAFSDLQRIPKIPKWRSSIEEQIKKVRNRVVAEHQRRDELQADSTLSMDQIMSISDPSRWNRE